MAADGGVQPVYSFPAGAWKFLGPILGPAPQSERWDGQTNVRSNIVDSVSWKKRQRPDPIRLAAASLTGARQRLADLDSPSWAARFTDAELERERSEAEEAIARASERIRALGANPDAVQ